ncbi:hypothetical protein HZF08_33765 [Paenibacillus sp. CGMCC 1.16610]|uniref:G5 domain-containing protein n=1 Tax=Paenibacillus anseongense TaxID=2682845 RepID=A0ABW9U0W3_9BACL|nr:MULTISPECIES: hypothetical protein [Paenibacillus]MBA2943241.1 hypothetical protein [Paenibacillus sp. CGMCC 1.16610]MVQ33739.1 hypothetical protein [Paenibacillus anseongense]
MTLLAVKNSPYKEVITNNHLHMLNNKPTRSSQHRAKGKQITAGLCIIGTLVGSGIQYDNYITEIGTNIKKVVIMKSTPTKADQTLTLEVANKRNPSQAALYFEDSVLISPKMEYTGESNSTAYSTEEDIPMRQTKSRVVKASIHKSGYVRHVFDVDVINDDYVDVDAELISPPSKIKKVAVKKVFNGYKPHVFKLDVEEEVSI